MGLKKTWNLLDDTQGHQEEEEKADRGDDLYHCIVKVLPAELFAVLGDLVDDRIGLDHPADQDTGGDGEDGHQDVVADVVEDVQDLRR